MRKQPRQLHTIVVAAGCMLTVAVSLYAATAVKSNTTKSAPQISAETDARLSRQVTYQSKQGRLHSAIEAMVAQTGVDIRCGVDKEDWKVRDIPVTLNVKDMPLDKMMLTLANVTHTSITIYSDDKGKPKYYRFVRDRKTQKDIDEAIGENGSVSMKRAAWNWDALVKFSKMTGKVEIDEKLVDSELKRQSMSESQRQAWIDAAKKELENADKYKTLGKLLESAGQDAKDKVLAGETVTLTTDSAASGPLIKDLHRILTKKSSGFDSDPSKITKASLYIGLRGEYAYGTLYAQIDGKFISKNHDCLESGVLAAVKGMDMGMAPGSGYPAPKPTTDVRTDWTQLGFDKKIKLKVPEDAKTLTAAEVLMLLSNASGLDVVSEDFESHREARIDASKLSQGETTVADVLKLIGSSYSQSWGWQWKIDESGSKLLGYATRWRPSHHNLVAEILFENMRTKMSGNGLELSEVASLLNLTPEQFADWVGCIKGALHLQVAFESNSKLFWQLFDYLSSEDKKSAQSVSGLPLSEVDPTWIRSFVAKQARELDPSSTPTLLGGAMSEEAFIKAWEDSWKIEDMLSNPAKFSSLTMYVVKSKATDRWAFDTSYVDNHPGEEMPTLALKPIVKGQTRHTYAMRLEGKVNGEDVKIDVPALPLAFPVYSLDREAVLEKEATKEQSK